MLDPGGTEGLAEAERRVLEDDSVGGGPIEELMDCCSQGLRYRLREVPVCGNCLGVYSAIHTALDLIRRQRRGRWAEREKRLRRESADREREQKKEELFEWMVAQRRASAVDSSPSRAKPFGTDVPPARGHKSLFLD